MPQPLMWKKVSWMFLWRPIRPSRTNTLKRCPFHHRGLECKSRKSGETWSSRQSWPWGTKWSRAKAKRIFQENKLVIKKKKKHLQNTVFQQQKRWLYTWMSPDGQYQNQIDYICIWRWKSLYWVSKNKTGSWQWLRSWAPYCKIQT